LAARAVRILLSVALPALLVLMLLRGIVPSGMQAFYESWVETAEWAIVTVSAVAVAMCFIWAKRRGLGFEKSFRLILGPTLASPGCNAPELSRLLAPSSGRVRMPSGDEPADYLRAIRELVPHVQGSSDSGLRAASTAESIVRSIERLDS